MKYWFNDPVLPRRAPAGGTVSLLNGRRYKGGQFMPFYVPRPTMPQVDEEQTPALLSYLARRGAAPSPETLLPSELRPHQRIDRIHAGRMSSSVRAKPILVSADNFILDGNHRWSLHKAEGSALNAWRVPLTFEKAAELICEFPGSYTLAHHAETN